MHTKIQLHENLVHTRHATNLFSDVTQFHRSNSLGWMSSTLYCFMNAHVGAWKVYIKALSASAKNLFPCGLVNCLWHPDTRHESLTMGVVVAVDTWLQRLVLVTVVAPTLTPAPVSVIRLSPVGPLLGTLAHGYIFFQKNLIFNTLLDFSKSLNY